MAAECLRAGRPRARQCFSRRLQVIGRLRDGMSIEQAQTQMNQVTARLAQRAARVDPLVALRMD